LTMIRSYDTGMTNPEYCRWVPRRQPTRKSERSDPAAVDRGSQQRAVDLSTLGGGATACDALSARTARRVEMRRIALLLIAVLLIGLVPAVASAQTDEEKAAAIALLDESSKDLEGHETVEDWAAAAEAFKASVADFKEAHPDLDYTALDAAIADLDAAIEGGDLDEIAAAAAVAKGEAEALAAEAGEGGDGTEEPTAVDTGSAVSDGPNVAMLAVAGMLTLFAVGVFGVRKRFDSK